MVADSTTDGSSTSSGTDGIVDTLTRPIVMAGIGGFVLAIIAGYYVI